MVGRSTRLRILDTALDLFGTRGVGAVSLDDIADAVGVRKQTVLYWFKSRSGLIDAVLDHAADEMLIVVEAAIRSKGDDPIERVDAVVCAVFRPVVRRPALLGLIREVIRLEEHHINHLRSRLAVVVERCVSYLTFEMEKGRLRKCDPMLLAGILYSTVSGTGTEPIVLETFGWKADAAGLRQVRRELRGFVRASLQPGAEVSGG